ncbi:dynein axonemal intermediate chain 4-like [Saccoglossus kowalevskii]|uniref:Dynein axonemal intermediate chain 4 n=1 Tax=Saccoglossus kowalevskii TaxID=10224 RepID=A0ABM0GN75_SACKO|nr:PREDICTED: WD repeat-containing protein 78-like [Saccoglossus kowalevskii]
MNKSSKTSTLITGSQSRGRDKQTTFAASRTTVATSSSRRSGGALDKDQQKLLTSKHHGVVVLDEMGHDVTPQSLLVIDPNAVRPNQSKIFGHGGADSTTGTPTDLMSQASIYQTGNASFAGPFTRSVFGSTSQSGRSTPESMSDEIAEPGDTDIPTGFEDIQHRREVVKEELTEDDLEKLVDITLSESDTIWLLDMPATCVSTESDEAAYVKEKIAKYNELVKSRVGNDRYAERGMQTFNEAPKQKEVQTTRITHADAGCMATNWDMYDTYAEMNPAVPTEEEEDDDIPLSRPTSGKTHTSSSSNEGKKTIDSHTGRPESRSSLMTASIASESTVAGLMSKDTTSVSDMATVIDEAILKSDELKQDLFIMERVVTHNIYQPKQAAFRDLPILIDIDKEVGEDEGTGPVSIAQLGPNIDRLWAYSCSITKSRNVSCMSWNKINQDLLAVGYGQFGFTEQKGGLACCWSLKNPEYPERVYHTEAGVTAMDFSATNPNLLAHYYHHLLHSSESNGKHSAPVWQLKWIEKERGSGDDKGEVLVSISTDGRVTQWLIRKGFECSDLMKLKRISVKQGKKGQEAPKKTEAFISRQAPGTCFDFNAKDSNIYLAGTEEGHIHKCSCSYNEQYLDTYIGHTGPVYKVQWSPFLTDVFLSCSADWSIRLWRQDRIQPIVNFYSSTKAVMDISWSPKSATVFGCVNEGAVEIWDLNVSTLDPIIVSVPAPGVKYSTLIFAFNSDCILVGDSEGQVSVFQLRCMPSIGQDQVEVLQKIVEQNTENLSNKNK